MPSAVLRGADVTSMFTSEPTLAALTAADLDKLFPKMRGSKQSLTAGLLQTLAQLKLKAEIRDYGAPGLGVMVGQSGAMSWAVRYRQPNGRALS